MVFLVFAVSKNSNVQFCTALETNKTVFPSEVNAVYVEHAMIGCSCTRFGKRIIEINALACHIYTKQGKLVYIGSRFPALQIDGFVVAMYIIMLVANKFSLFKNK